MKNFDTIIIGSGSGGLSAAICLARAGQKVLVLEQHDVPGGWCHSFQLGAHRFSPGVHYIGMVGKGESTSLLYEGLGVANEMVFFRMNKNAYEHCWIEEEKFDIPAGFDKLGESLSQRFPKEKKGIKNYLKLVRDVSTQVQLIPKMNGFWDAITIPWRTRHMGKYGLFSLKRVINWYLKDPLLKAILSVQCGDHGLPPSRASFPVHCVVMDHYSEGAYYPMGGGGGIVKAMTNTFKTHGGEIRTRQEVKKIIVEEGAAKGVVLANGEEIYADTILSNADPGITFQKLIGQERLSAKLNKKLQKTKYSVTSLILFLTLDLDVTKSGIDSGNIWRMNNRDLDLVFKDMTVQDLLVKEEFPALFLSCTTLKDPVSFDGKHHNIEVVTFIDYNSFDEFNQDGDHHGLAYEQHKERIIEKLMNSVEKIIPGAKEHVVQLELGTPKTNQYYIQSTNGNVYGTEKTFGQIGPFSFQNKTEIKNLYMCGASIMAHGVAGAANSGVQAAAQILNCRAEELLAADDSQRIRVYDAEDSSSWPDWVWQKRKVKEHKLAKA